MNFFSMLRIALLCLLLCNTVAYGQQDTLSTTGSDVPYTQYADSIMDNLDKSRVPHGILYDRVFPYAGLKDTLTINDTINTEFLIQAYSEIQRSDYSYVPHPDTFDYTMLRKYIYSENGRMHIPIIALNYLYASIDSPSFTNGCIDIVNGLMYDGTNTASPYKEHNTLITALGVSHELALNTNYELQFPVDYQFGNHSTNWVTSVVIYNHTDATTTTVDSGGTATVSFSQSGMNTLEIRMTMGSGPVLKHNQTVYVAQPKATIVSCTSSRIDIAANIGFKGYDEPTLDYGKGEYKILYSHTGNCKMTNPILIIDGFDPEDVRKIEHIYQERLAYTNSNGNPANFADELRYDGYDVVILNFPTYKTHLEYTTVFDRDRMIRGGMAVSIDIYRNGGGDFIERNAMVMIEMLDEINRRLVANNAADNEIVVVGPSMGGQISRYGLKYMEDNNWNHNTRLWISFDSPHHGANIPYGFQEMMRYLWKGQNISSAGNTYNVQFRASAARQMLIHQADPGGPNNQPWSYNAFADKEPFRQTWKDILSNMGFPNNLRKIAVVNGSSMGGDYHTPGTDIFNLKVRTKKTGVLLSTATPNFMNTTQSQIARFWKLWPTTFYTVNTHSTLVYGPIDACPGGTYDIQQIFYDEAHGTTDNQSWPVGFSHTTVENKTKDIAFISTVSGLALYNPFFDWSNSLDVGDILCNNKSPFDNIYVPAQNESHTSLTASSVQWIKDEIFRGQNPCPKICNAYIGGVSSMKVNDIATFNLFNKPSAFNVTWSVSSNLQIQSSTSTSITVNRVGSSKDFITAQIHNTCGADEYIIKMVTTAAPKNSLSGIKEEQTKEQLEFITSKANLVKAYPNPASKAVTFEYNVLEDKEHLVLTITNIAGQVVEQVKLNQPSGIYKWQTKQNLSGLYLFELSSNSKKIDLGRIVIAK